MTLTQRPEAGAALFKQSVTGLTLPRLERMRAAYEDDLILPKALRVVPVSSVRRALAIVEAEITQRRAGPARRSADAEARNRRIC